jgi:hypothetical protein
MILMPNHPNGRKSAKAGLSSLKHFVALKGVSSVRK